MRTRIFIAACLLLLSSVVPAVGVEYEFRVAFDAKVHSQPYTGRVYLFFSRTKGKEPRRGPDWFHPEPFVGLDVEGWKPGEELTLKSSAPEKMLAFPKPLAELNLEGYSVQAVARFNPYERNVGTGAGNGFSQPAPVAVSKSPSSPLLVIDNLVPEQKFPETHWCKLLATPSKLLSDFHHREMFLRASVVLPTSYFDQPERRYPVIFNIPGFGGTHLMGAYGEPIKEANQGGVEFLRVTLDPSCPLGHHVFADSANNGPVGQALVDELIPKLDREFRTIAQPTARFLTGHSSGGWSSLWLQVTYPGTFGGTWSTAPDPVDFHDFQRIDLYQPGENMYRDAQGGRRPLARSGDTVLLWYDDFDRMETTLGYGGQLHSFEAVFSPRGVDGKPLLAWDRTTGAVRTDVARTWEKYDIRLILEKNWKELAAPLKGKLHVIMGDLDTFYLEGATRRLQSSLRMLGSDAVVEFVPGKNHFNLLSPELTQRMRSEIVQSFLRNHPEERR